MTVVFKPSTEQYTPEECSEIEQLAEQVMDLITEHTPDISIAAMASALAAELAQLPREHVAITVDAVVTYIARMSTDLHSQIAADRPTQPHTSQRH